MVDYSKWKDIEVSDDEDDTHPNIDTASLFRWRHQARVERMAEQEQEKQKIKQESEQCKKKMEEISKKMVEVDLTEKEKISKKLNELKEKEKELEKQEKLQPWNIDTISHDGFSKTVINAGEATISKEKSEEETEKEMNDFISKYKEEIKTYGMFQRYDDSRKFLQEKPYLVCDYTANYLVVWCINLEMEEKHTLVDHVAHQVICMQFLLDLAKQLGRHPKTCISAFFHRIQTPEPVYQKIFNEELDAFKNRIRTRAAQKLEEAFREAEEEERKARLGPGGLDPMEVVETLPEELQKCFESLDVELLQTTIAKMDPKDAAYHMKRCVDSGLWVPDASKSADDQDDIYESVD